MPRILQPVLSPVFMDTADPNYLQNLQSAIFTPNLETTLNQNYHEENSTFSICPNTTTNNTITFSAQNTWALKIENKQIIFNTQELTIDEITKQFLKRLSELTHIDDLQYTFDF